MWTKKVVHILNVWTIIMQSLNMKEWKLLELQITKTRHPLSISEGKKCPSSTPLKNKKIFTKCAQNRRCTSSMNEQLLCKVWMKRNGNCWSYRLHKPDTP